MKIWPRRVEIMAGPQLVIFNLRYLVVWSTERSLEFPVRFSCESWESEGREGSLPDLHRVYR